MNDKLSAHAEHFLKQAHWCEVLGSPFNAGLLRGLSGMIGQGGVIDSLLSEHGAPLDAVAADAGPLRVAGALHALALSGRDAVLQAQYPAVRADWDLGDVLPAAIAALETHTAWIADFIARPPQTNETRRAIGLLAGFAQLEGPLHLLEIGASAGLNQHWDAFFYDGGTWSRPGAEGAPVIATHWQGPPPILPERFHIASRRACDLTPLEVEDDFDRLRLRSYIWPDQTDRLERLDRAVVIARERGVRVETASADDWLEEVLSGPLAEGTSVIYHSIAWQYFDADTHRRASAAIEAAGARTNASHRLAWLRLEHAKVFGNQGEDYVLDLVTWPGGERARLGQADPHLRWLRANSGD